ncbi:MAG: hypothetical protein O9254_00075 [Rhodobacteraceae bacterium]|nr:hypothetical protein [Paracoccaceae bacterium]
MIKALRHCRDYGLDLLLRFGQPTLGIRLLRPLRQPFLVHLTLILSDELRDEVWVHQSFLQPRQNSFFDIHALDRSTVLAGAAVARGGAAVAAVADHHIASAAAPAVQQPGQQIPGPAS